MNEAQAKSLLLDYLYGELPPEKREELEAHLELSPGCQKELESLQSAMGGYRVLPRPATPPAATVAAIALAAAREASAPDNEDTAEQPDSIQLALPFAGQKQDISSPDEGSVLPSAASPDSTDVLAKMAPVEETPVETITETPEIQKPQQEPESEDAPVLHVVKHDKPQTQADAEEKIEHKTPKYVSIAPRPRGIFHPLWKVAAGLMVIAGIIMVLPSSQDEVRSQQENALVKSAVREHEAKPSADVSALTVEERLKEKMEDTSVVPMDAAVPGASAAVDDNRAGLAGTPMAQPVPAPPAGFASTPRTPAFDADKRLEAAARRADKEMQEAKSALKKLDQRLVSAVPEKGVPAPLTAPSLPKTKAAKQPLMAGERGKVRMSVRIEDAPAEEAVADTYADDSIGHAEEMVKTAEMDKGAVGKDSGVLDRVGFGKEDIAADSDLEEDIPEETVDTEETSSEYGDVVRDERHEMEDKLAVTTAEGLDRKKPEEPTAELALHDSLAKRENNADALAGKKLDIYRQVAKDEARPEETDTWKENGTLGRKRAPAASATRLKKSSPDTVARATAPSKAVVTGTTQATEKAPASKSRARVMREKRKEEKPLLSREAIQQEAQAAYVNAQKEYQNGNYEAALSQVNRCLQLVPNHPQIASLYVLKARCELRLGRLASMGQTIGRLRLHDRLAADYLQQEYNRAIQTATPKTAVPSTPTPPVRSQTATRRSLIERLRNQREEKPTNTEPAPRAIPRRSARRLSTDPYDRE